MTEAITKVCKLCGHTQFKTLFDREFQVLLCHNCGLVFVSDRDRDHRAYYTEEYDYRLSDHNRSEHAKIDESVFKWVIKHLPETEKQTLIEIGCGTGFLLKKFKDHGFIVFGVEPSKRAVEFARQVNGIEEIACCMLQDIDVAQRSYDIVILVQTLEHFADPLNDLSRIRGLLKKDGLLFIEVPHYFAPNGFYTLEIDGVAYPSPNHLFVYSRKTLSAFLRKAGFSVSRTSTTIQNLRIVATVDGDDEDAGFESYTKVLAYFYVLPIITRSIHVMRCIKNKLMGARP